MHFTITITGFVIYDDDQCNSWPAFEISLVDQYGRTGSYDITYGSVQENGDDETHMTLSDAQDDLPMRIQELIEEWAIAY